MIYELRRYTLHPGRRETLIELFEREFVEPQEAVGMRIAGTFRDPDAPDTFPWIRGFPDMATRHAALTAFYSGPVWRAHRDAANATMIDSDDVLLLRSAIPIPAWDRPPVGANETPAARYVATIYHVEPGHVPGFAEFFAKTAVPVLTEAGVPPFACLETEHAENTFSALPVRAGENVFVWLARFADPGDEREIELPGLESRLTAPPRRLRLAPTARSSMR
ncbi:NIPSNAP family protein [Nonomuraea sp. NN258]|uniref:NIPSNAP family protein n=1 Tax=Nonomuraea antri TaxID=2730852 RepID=UPI0015684267|nr:NIPSNAP family protein [Nonomuraea antri]NRQ34817.1 NIPSNAP family protein [Nonomuraea antri]